MVRFDRHIQKCLFAVLAAALMICGFHSRCLGQYGAYSANSEIGIDSTSILLDSAMAMANVSPLQALPILNRTLETAILHHNLNGEAKAFIAIASVQRSLGHPAAAKESLLRCKTLFGDAGLGDRTATNSTYGGSYSNSTYGGNKSKPAGASPHPSLLLEASLALTQVYEDQEEYQEAYREAESSLQLIRLNPINTQINNVLRTQGRLTSKMGKSKSATEKLERLLESERKTADQRGECATLIELGDHYFRNGDNVKAKATLEQAIGMAQKRSFNDENIRAARTLATIYKAEGDLKKELDLRNSVLGLTNSTADVQNNFLQNIAIGNAYLENNQPDLAEQYVESGVEKITSTDPPTADPAHPKTVPCASQPNSAELQVGADAYRQLAEGYLKKSELEKSLEYFKKYAIL